MEPCIYVNVVSMCAHTHTMRSYHPVLISNLLLLYDSTSNFAFSKKFLLHIPWAFKKNIHHLHTFSEKKTQRKYSNRQINQTKVYEKPRVNKMMISNEPIQPTVRERGNDVIASSG